MAEQINTIADIFNSIAQYDALIVEPATDAEIERCNEDLQDIELPTLPEEYVDFLKVANGFAWNGFEFFGTYQVREKATGYTLRDIVGYNEDRGYSDDVLIVGTFDEDIYTYVPAESVFRSVDRLTKIEVETYDNFRDMIMGSVALYVD